MDIELQHEFSPVAFHGLYANGESNSDFLIALASDEKG